MKRLLYLFKRSYSISAIGFVFLFMIISSFTLGLWKQNRIIIDGPSYYTYLPAVFIYHDLTLNFIDKTPAFYKDKIWYYKIENGNKLIKHPPGLSLTLSPFFLMGHMSAGLSGREQDGYSLSYQNAITIGVWIYVLLGLLFLRKTLLFFFTEKTTALTLITIVTGTNLLWYSTFEGFMPHAVSFSLLCICIYNFFSWLKNENKKHLIVFACCFGLTVLIRPLGITTIIYFILIAIGNKGGLKPFFQFLAKHLRILIVAVLLCLTILSLQFIYWKYITGKWMYDVYIGEHFIFDSPQILPFLFSFRKGIFIYTPVLFFSMIGLLVFYKKNRPVFYSTLTLLLLTIYLLSSWWAWSYGISWGIRPMIDYYSFLSLPLAAGFNYVFSKKKFIAVLSYTLVFLFISLNLFQTWQYKNGLIHYDDMSKEAYFRGFLQTSPTAGWHDLLKPYNWERRIAGLPQIKYSKQLIHSLTPDKKIYLRGSNMQYVSASEQSEFIVTCNFNTVTEEEIFHIDRLWGDTIAIKTTAGKYLSVKPMEHNIIVADANTVGENELFILTVLNNKDNRIAIRTVHNRYLSTGNKFPFIVVADKKETATNEIFRLFLADDYQGKP